MPGWLTEAVIVQAISTVGIILSAGIPAFFVFRSKLSVIVNDAREAREQVKNCHDTNLREEGDVRHEATMSALKELGREVRGPCEDHYETRKGIGMPMVRWLFVFKRQSVHGLARGYEPVRGASLPVC
ncbi:DUF2746 domain-containing protein [Glutamicibacter sp. AOP3-A1-12]|uniref:DUF2746 domain-containing protein n=1 Tax=Glutamicibacter sp. AOP3-A1-12 TaxID=3457701 RepID=UPI004033C109